MAALAERASRGFGATGVGAVRIHIVVMAYRDVVTVVAIVAIIPAAAVPYFYLFWSRFDFWRRHPIAAYSMMFGVIGGVAALAIGFRDPMRSIGLALPYVVVGVGWLLIGAAFIFGTVADRQIGFYVRSFMPFFEQRGHIELKTNGAYGVVRHPIYASGLWFQIGAALVTGRLAVAVAAIVFGLGARWFTRQEERHLVTLLRDPTDYDRYRERVPALFPRLR